MSNKIRIVEFMTNEELIKELVKRKTFLGAVIASPDELKEDKYRGESRRFRCYSKNLNAGQVIQLLTGTAKAIAQKGKL